MESKEYESSIMALFYDGKLLILKRGSTAPWMPNKWSLVGGEIDEGESAVQAAKRECQEEVGLLPNGLQFSKKVISTSMGVMYYFVGQLASDNVTLDYENTEYAFITKADMKKYDFVPAIIDFMLSVMEK